MVSTSRQTTFVAIRIFVTHVLTTNVYETSFQLRFCIHESRDPRHRGLSVSSEERTLGMTKFFELLVVLIALLHPYESLHQRVGCTAPAVRIPRSCFPRLFLLFFRSRRTLPQSTCIWLVHTRCSIDISRMSLSLCLFVKVHCSHSKIVASMEIQF